MSTLIEVRCCCDPTKLLGWLPVPDVKLGMSVRFATRPRMTVSTGEITPTVCVTLPVGAITRSGYVYLALKSEETPIEVLRQIPGFREA